MNRLRELLRQYPWAGWAVAGVLLLVAAFFAWRGRGAGPYSLDRMTADLTIRCAETGEEWTVPRGRVEAELRQRAGLIDTGQGLVNPKTGRATGFPVAREWNDMVQRVNADKQAMLSRTRRAPAPPEGEK